MITDAIPDKSWTAYATRKKQEGADPLTFDGNQAWEVNYLGRIIRKQYPDLSADEIRAAIKACCKQTGIPYNRPAFVADVMYRLA